MSDIYDGASIESPDNDNKNSGSSRKRKAGSNSRGVASLTAEQLSKKRANDREAQRAIRERTRNQIQNYEDQIRELKAQQPYQELQTIVRQKDAIQAENEEIRRRLTAAVELLQPFVNAQALQTDDSTERRFINTGQNDAILELAHVAQQNVVGMTQPSPTFSNDQYAYSHMPARSIPNQPMHIQQQTIADPTTFPTPTSIPSSEHDRATDQAWPNQKTALTQQRESMQRSHELSQNGERLNFNFLIDSAIQRSIYASTVPDRRSPAMQTHPVDGSHAWSMLPKNCEPTCPLDKILLNFLTHRKQEHSRSSTYPSISKLLNPTTSTGSSPAVSHSRGEPLSNLMTDIISKFPNISDLPERLATTFCMFIFMRWQIYPTPENYHRLPEWLTPRPSQIFTPHPAWMDNIPWPRMRDRIIHNSDDYKFDNWFVPFTTGLSVNWPYEEHDCLIITEGGGEPLLNPVFERHILRLENWSIGPQFVRAFPDLADTCLVRERNTTTFSMEGEIGQDMPLHQIHYGEQTDQRQ